jgi:hypothetical protein
LLDHASSTEIRKEYRKSSENFRPRKEYMLAKDVILLNPMDETAEVRHGKLGFCMETGIRPSVCLRFFACKKLMQLPAKEVWHFILNSWYVLTTAINRELVDRTPRDRFEGSHWCNLISNAYSLICSNSAGVAY